jgi:transcription factor SFP1
MRSILMSGTSPFAFQQSPSYHSSSYLPKMEANMLKGYECCGTKLDSLHELLQHWEENHAQQSNQVLMHTQNDQGQASNNHPLLTVQGVPSAQNSQRTIQTNTQQSQQRSQQQQNSMGAVQDVDSLDDMDMDDNVAPPTPHATNFGYQSMQPQQNYQQSAPRVPPLNMNLANAMQTHQAMRTSNPSTPASAVQPGFNFNASISSVNTPTFTTPTSTTQRSADSSIPGTPQATDFGELPLGQDFSTMNLNFNAPMDAASLNAMMQDPNWANMNFGMEHQAPPTNMTIDEPAKRLFSKSGGQLTQQQLQHALRTGQFGNDENTQMAIAQQINSRGAVGGMLGARENKPFKCPVIGCEKAYKNQNGLKARQVPRRYFEIRLTAALVPQATRPPEPDAPGKRRWVIFHPRPCHQHPLPRKRGNGEGEAVQVRFLR